MEIRPIAYYHSPLQSRFGVPRQSGLADDLEGRIVFEPEFRREEALRGLLGDGGFNRIWLIWGFSANRETASSWQPLVRPPRLGGNASMGVFATRSPYRPNPLGLSTVSLVRIEDCELHVQGADLMDGTPIYDIKPYIVYADSKAFMIATNEHHEDFVHFRIDKMANIIVLQDKARRLPKDMDAYEYARNKLFMYSGNMEYVTSSGVMRRFWIR